MSEYMPIEKHSTEITQTLAHSRIFQRLPETSFAAIFPLAQLHGFEEGEVILRTGDENHDVYFLIKGRVSIVSDHETIYTLKRAGDIFGEMSILTDDHACSANVIAAAAVQVLSIHTRHFGNDAPKALHQLFSIVLAEKLLITTKKAHRFEKTNTALLKAKAELQTSHQELEQRYKELKRELTRNTIAERERAELELLLQQSQKLETLGILSHGIADGFNHFLSLIVHNAEMGKSQDPESTSTNHYLEKILDACQQAAGLSQQVLSFNQAITIKLELLNLAKEIDHSLHHIRASLPSNIKVHVHFEGGHHCIAARSAHIHQMIVCLCLNASHAMLKTGGLLEVTLRKVETDVENLDKSDAGYLELAISDMGHDMSKEMNEKIWQPFSTAEQDSGAAGLGLALVQGIVHQYRGVVRVESVLHKGSTFKIYFPICKTLHQPSAVDPPEKMMHGKGDILLIGEEQGLLYLYKKYLNTLGYQVTVTNNSVTATELLRSKEHDFKVTIINQDTWHDSTTQVYQEILKMKLSLPMVLMAYDLTPPSELTPSQYLVKPIALQQLRSAVLNAIFS